MKTRKRNITIQLSKHVSIRAYDKYNRQMNIRWKRISFDKFAIFVDHYDSEGYYISWGHDEFNMSIDTLYEYLDQIVKESKLVKIY